jgi:GTP-binding protein
MNNSIVAIVGRPNVGKSTLFNRLVQRREAIVDSVSGVTRDRHYGKSDWNGKEFSVIDTGGYIIGSDDIFEGEIRKQVSLAIEEADLIVFVVNVEDGITPMDAEVAKLLRKVKKPIFTVVNKVDNAMREPDAVEFYNLGLGEYYTIASINGSGTGDLLDALAEKMPEPEEIDLEKEELPRFAVVGRPNAGKSSFINSLIGEDRNIVTNIAGTTRDSIDTKYNRFDVIILVVDATRGFEGQDQNIFWLAEKNRKGVVILINKWDLIEKETNTMRDFEAMVRKQIEPFTDVPIVFISALTKQRLFKAIETAVEVFGKRKMKIPTSKLNDTMLDIVKSYPPPATKGKFVKIKYCMQLPTPTPQFAFFCNLPQYVRDPYKRFLENKLREIYDFTGTPITIYFRQK